MNGKELKLPGHYLPQDFEDLGKEELVKILGEYGIGIFYFLVNEDPKLNPVLISKYFEIIYHIKTTGSLTKPFRGEMWYYDEQKGLYKNDAETFIQKKLKTWFEDRYVSLDKYDKMIFKDLRASTHKSLEILKLDPIYIPIKNGIIRINIGEVKKEIPFSLLPKSPDYFITNHTPVEYVKNAKCPNWLQFLNETFYPEDIPFLQEFIGYCMYRKNIFHKCIMLIGPTRTGKSTFLNVITTFLGKETVCSIALQDLEDKFQRIRIRDKNANIMADMNNKALKNSSFFKQLTGGDTISAEEKYKQGIEFIPYCKYLWSCNELPVVYDDNPAFWERIRLIIVNKKQHFSGNPETDPNMAEKLCEELPGILNWALEGLLRLLRNKDFMNNVPWEETRKKWMLWSDPLARFLESEWIAWDPQSFVPKQDFYSHFVVFSEFKKLDIWSIELVGREMKKRLRGDYVESYRNIGGKQVKCWNGIKLIDPDYNVYSDEDAQFERRREELI